MKKIISIAALAAVMAGCATTNDDYGTYNPDNFEEETLTTTDSLNDSYLLAAAPKYYTGTAYKIDDVQYIPTEDMSYNQTGIAGIIPMELNGQKTSNGETFDSSQMLATSKTLPLPTIARVTNLNNGNSVVVRVNNRGPFVNTRIMDLSPAAAQKIGLTSQAKVQIQVLPEQTMLVKNATLGIQPTQQVAEPQPVVVQPEPQPAPAPVVNGNYTVQIAAFYAEDSADAMVAKMRTYGDAVVINEGGMYKVRIINLDATNARRVIDALRTNEGMAPGLLKDGHWINADSI
ncbi:MAG: septal ring lytic transglycosylase RlpA family protein [Alphaproteobacteria bacterium]